MEEIRNTEEIIHRLIADKLEMEFSNSIILSKENQ